MPTSRSPRRYSSWARPTTCRSPSTSTISTRPSASSSRPAGATSAGRREGPSCDPDVVTCWGALGRPPPTRISTLLCGRSGWGALHDGVDLDGNLLALHRHLAEVARLEEVLDLEPGRLADDDGHVEVLGDALEPRTQVDGIADRGVLEALPRTDRADDGVAGIDADAAAETAAVFRREALGERLQTLLELERGADGLRRMVGRLERHVVQRHDGVADVLVDGAAVPEDGLGDLGQVLAQERHHLFWLHLLRHRREATNVGEEHGHAATAGPEARVVFLAHDLLDHVRREKPREPPLFELLLGEILGDDADVRDDQRQRHRQGVHPEALPAKGRLRAGEVEKRRARDQEKGGERPERRRGPSCCAARHHRQPYVDPRRRPADRNAGEQRVEDIRVDHHPRHVAKRSEGSRKHILEELRGRSDHDDLPLEYLRGYLSADDAGVGDARKGVRRARVIDPELRRGGQGRRPDAGGLRESIDLQIEPRILAVLKVHREPAAADKGVTVGEDIDRTPRGRAGTELRERRLDLLQLLDPAGVP